MNVKMIPLHKVKPYDKNIKDHPKSQLEAIKASIKEFGFKQPIVIDKHNVIVAGHARYAAAEDLNINEIPCIDASDLSDKQVKAYRILDNEIAKQGSTNIDNLQIELADIPDFDFEPYNVKFPEVEVINPGLTNEDDIPEFINQPITKLGDLWLLGNHRLICGDSTIDDSVEELFNCEKPFIMITDPPYGVDLDQSWRDSAKKGQKFGPGNRNKVSNDDRADWKDAYSLFNGSIAYVWHASKFTDIVKNNLENCDFDVRQMIIWNKSVMVLGRSAYHWKHEPCWYAVKNGCDANWKGDRKQTTVWDAISPNHIMGGSQEDKTEHPTQKPVLLFENPIHNHTDKNHIVYDPFGGSGTCIIAAEKLNRRCFTMELSPSYCDVIIHRWQNYTGKKALLESTNQSYDEISNG